MYTQIDHKQLSKDLLKASNQLRSDPKCFIEKLEATMKQFKGTILSKPMEYAIQTVEGKDAFLDAIAFLKKQSPVPTLQYDERLEKSSTDHVYDLGPKGLASHEGSDGKSVYDRIEKYCEWDKICSENIDLGGRTADDILVNILVDDGVPDRGHRKILFSDEVKYFGCMSAPHKDFGIITVLNYVGGIRNLGTESPDVANFISDYCNRTLDSGKRKKNLFQKDDPDAPDNTTSVKIQRCEKNINNRLVNITKKIYTLDDGTQFIVEVDEQ